MYQPLWIEGHTVGEARRDAVGRYDAIKARIAHLGPGVSMVDVGAHSGYFAYRFADELAAEVLAIDGDEALRAGYTAQGGTTSAARVTPVFANLHPGQLPKLGPFDVGLCLSVLHHLPWWPLMIGDLLNACHLLFIECAVPGENLGSISHRTGPPLEAVQELPGAELVCLTPGFDNRQHRPMYMVPGRAPLTVKKA